MLVRIFALHSTLSLHSTLVFTQLLQSSCLFEPQYLNILLQDSESHVVLMFGT